MPVCNCRYFADAGLDALEYRGIDFKIERHFGVNGYQLPNSVINYPGLEVGQYGLRTG